MNVLNTEDLAQIFASLAGGPRIQVLQALREKILNCHDPVNCDLSERCCSVSELAETLGVSLPAISYHLRELRLAGLIQTERRGKHVYSAINPATMEQLTYFLEVLTQEAFAQTGDG